MSVKKIIIIIILSIILYFIFKVARYMYYSEGRTLTKQPINIDKHMVISLDKDIHNFAESTFEINISNTINDAELRESNFEEYEEKVRSIFPKASLELCVYHSNDKDEKYCKESNEYYVFYNRNTFLRISFYDIPKHTPFNRVEITTKVPLKDTTIVWSNWRI